MTRLLLLITTLTQCLMLASAQQQVVERHRDLEQKTEIFKFDERPHLILQPTFNLNGGGFATTSQEIAGGVDFEAKHMAFRATASYNNARKANDGTGSNPKGHIRSLNGQLLYRLRNYWFAGTEVGWGQLSTTNYSKQGWAQSFGGGRDFLVRDTSFRLRLMYTPPFRDHSNGSQGPTFEFILPSPLAQRHVYFYERLDVSFLHATITDPANRILTEQQTADRSHTASLQLGLMFRF
jgi:hypothetical protein